MRLVPLVLSLACLAGCAGYAADYLGSKERILMPQLTRYGLERSQAFCVADRLGTRLTVWQMRQLEMAAARVAPGSFHPIRLTLRDLNYAASQVEDPQVAPELARAAEACGVSAADVPTLNVTYAAPRTAAGPAGVDGASAPASAAPAPAPATGSAGARGTWVNLGAAGTGQSIAVDAASVVQEAPFRRAWFRLTDPGAPEPVPITYLLRIDCEGRTINSMAQRWHGPNGGVAEFRSHGPNGEGEMPVEGGTVMEIAWLALCT